MRKRKFTKAKTIDRKLIDLAVQWVKGEITYTKFCAENNRPPHSNAYIFLARALKVAYRSKLL